MNQGYGLSTSVAHSAFRPYDGGSYLDSSPTATTGGATPATRTSPYDYHPTKLDKNVKKNKNKDASNSGSVNITNNYNYDTTKARHQRIYKKKGRGEMWVREFQQQQKTKSSYDASTYNRGDHNDIKQLVAKNDDIHDATITKPTATKRPPPFITIESNRSAAATATTMKQQQSSGTSGGRDVHYNNNDNRPTTTATVLVTEQPITTKTIAPSSLYVDTAASWSSAELPSTRPTSPHNCHLQAQQAEAFATSGTTTVQQKNRQDNHVAIIVGQHWKTASMTSVAAAVSPVRRHPHQHVNIQQRVGTARLVFRRGMKASSTTLLQRPVVGSSYSAFSTLPQKERFATTTKTNLKDNVANVAGQHRTTASLASMAVSPARRHPHQHVNVQQRVGTGTRLVFRRGMTTSSKTLVQHQGSVLSSLSSSSSSPRQQKEQPLPTLATTLEQKNEKGDNVAIVGQHRKTVSMMTSTVAVSPARRHPHQHVNIQQRMGTARLIFSRGMMAPSPLRPVLSSLSSSSSSSTSSSEPAKFVVNEGITKRDYYDADDFYDADDDHSITNVSRHQSRRLSTNKGSVSPSPRTKRRHHRRRPKQPNLCGTATAMRLLSSIPESSNSGSSNSDDDEDSTIIAITTGTLTNNQRGQRLQRTTTTTPFVSRLADTVFRRPWMDHRHRRGTPQGP